MSKEKYNLEWFKNRAISSIKKISDGKWDYSDSLLLYLPKGEEIYESIQNEETDYYQIVTKPEIQYLKDIAKDVVSRLPEEFDYVDLGPGTENKENIFFEEIKRQRKKVTYIPVDISERYLEFAEKNALDQGLCVERVQSSFEELPSLLGNRSAPRFVNIGLTFSNYNPQEIIALLTEIAGKDGFFFMNSQMRDRIDMSAVMKIYSKDALAMSDDKLELLGIDLTKDITERYADDGVRVWCELLRPNKLMSQLGLKKGEELLVFQSLRYTKESLEREMVKAGGEFELFDIGGSFIGVLTKAIRK